MNKRDYFLALMRGTGRDPNIALLLWHMEVPLEQARQYMETYYRKVQGRPRNERQNLSRQTAVQSTKKAIEQLTCLMGSKHAVLNADASGARARNRT